jgi:hypothetical protein
MSYNIFHSRARVFCIDDTVSAPVGEGKVISDYVDGLLDRVSLKLVVQGNDMSWIAVNSKDFTSVCFDSRQFFERDLLSRLHDPIKLTTLVTTDRNLSPVERRNGLRHLDYFRHLKNIRGVGGCFNPGNPHESLSRLMTPEIPYYLGEGSVKSCFVAYQLD